MKFYKIKGVGEWDYLDDNNLYPQIDKIPADKMDYGTKENPKVVDLITLILEYNKDCILPEDLPEQKYGIYPIHLINGEAKVMTEAELKPYKESYEEGLKEKEYNEIDNLTKKRFSTEYFEFDNHKFSISLAAQQNWGDVAVLKLRNELPRNINISTKGDKEYMLSKENVDLFVQAYTKKKFEVLDENRKLKAQV